MSASRNHRFKPASLPAGQPASREESTCIGCGCTDSRACVDPLSGEPCSWIKVDRQFMIGACTSCEHKVDEFYAQLLEKMKA